MILLEILQCHGIFILHNNTAVLESGEKHRHFCHFFSQYLKMRTIQGVGVKRAEILWKVGEENAGIGIHKVAGTGRNREKNLQFCVVFCYERTLKGGNR